MTMASLCASHEGVDLGLGWEITETIFAWGSKIYFLMRQYNMDDADVASIIPINQLNLRNESGGLTKLTFHHRDKGSFKADPSD